MCHTDYPMMCYIEFLIPSPSNYVLFDWGWIQGFVVLRTPMKSAVTRWTGPVCNWSRELRIMTCQIVLLYIGWLAMITGDINSCQLKQLYCKRLYCYIPKYSVQPDISDVLWQAFSTTISMWGLAKPAGNGCVCSHLALMMSRAISSCIASSSTCDAALRLFSLIVIFCSALCSWSVKSRVYNVIYINRRGETTFTLTKLAPTILKTWHEVLFLYTLLYTNKCRCIWREGLLVWLCLIWWKHKGFCDGTHSTELSLLILLIIWCIFLSCTLQNFETKLAINNVAE